MHQLPHTTLAQVFLEARTFNAFSEQELPDALLHELYDLAKWGPTSFNSQPARFVFVRSADAKARLAACLSPRNAEKTLKAPGGRIVPPGIANFFGSSWSSLRNQPLKSTAVVPRLSNSTASSSGGSVCVRISLMTAFVRKT